MLSFSTTLRRLCVTLALCLALPLVAPAQAAAPAQVVDHSGLKAWMLQSPAIQNGFPGLRADDFVVIGPETAQYNCIAWSMGITDRWVNPYTGSPDNPLAEMDRAYANLGYKRAKVINFAVEPGKQKVVLYAKFNENGTIESVTHACRQEADGLYTSKLGKLPLIKHRTLESLSGPVYGLPVAVYERPAN